jgi:hypothetical protein
MALSSGAIYHNPPVPGETQDAGIFYIRNPVQRQVYRFGNVQFGKIISIAGIQEQGLAALLEFVGLFQADTGHSFKFRDPLVFGDLVQVGGELPPPGHLDQGPLIGETKQDSQEEQISCPQQVIAHRPANLLHFPFPFALPNDNVF